MAIVTIGILAHVDAGRTSLTEPILYETGVIPALGTVCSWRAVATRLGADTAKRRGIPRPTRLAAVRSPFGLLPAPPQPPL